MTDINLILAERGKVHGSFEVHALFATRLKAILRDSDNGFTSAQLEAMDMIQHKIARILAGDPNHIDHWDDIAGYATLVANLLRSQKSTQGSEPSFGEGKPEQP